MLRNKEKTNYSDIDTQESLLYTCVVPDEGSVSCTMLVEATRWWVCCWCILSIDCTEVAIAGAASPLWEPWDNGSTADPFSSTILSIARLPRELCKHKSFCTTNHPVMCQIEKSQCRFTCIHLNGAIVTHIWLQHVKILGSVELRGTRVI